MASLDLDDLFDRISIILDPATNLLGNPGRPVDVSGWSTTAANLPVRFEANYQPLDTATTTTTIASSSSSSDEESESMKESALYMQAVLNFKFLPLSPVNWASLFQCACERRCADRLRHFGEDAQLVKVKGLNPDNPYERILMDSTKRDPWSTSFLLAADVPRSGVIQDSTSPTDGPVIQSDEVLESEVTTSLAMLQTVITTDQRYRSTTNGPESLEFRIVTFTWSTVRLLDVSVFPPRSALDTKPTIVFTLRHTAQLGKFGDEVDWPQIIRWAGHEDGDKMNEKKKKDENKDEGKGKQKTASSSAACA